jgi:hypothetical protein
MSAALEAEFEQLCSDFEIRYERPEQQGERLDFFLPDFWLYVEVKHYACERMVAQAESVGGPVMFLVGPDSVNALRKLLEDGRKSLCEGVCT